MLVYRITLAEFADKLRASGRAARWSRNKVEMIYTSSSRSLACLENVVHCNQLALAGNFRILTIEIPEEIQPEIVELDSLPSDWKEFSRMALTQAIGSCWIEKKTSCVIRVPSSIIPEEYNFLINPVHPDFHKINILKVDDFVFDERIKR